MSDDQNIPGIFNLTKPVIMPFPALLEPKKFKRNGKETGEPKFQASFIFDKDNPDLAAMKALVSTIAKQHVASWQPGDLKFPFSDGNKLIAKRVADLEKQGKKYTGDADFQKDKVVIKSRSKFQPKLSVFENGKILDLDDEALRSRYKGQFYSGVEVYAQFNFVWYDGVDEGKPGVTAYLNLVLSTNKGKRIGGGATGSSVFAAVAGKVSAEDPTEGLDDEIPF
jgi:hypothetical protein